MALPAREPTQARSIATRAALLDAAVDCLTRDGYAAVTTTGIASRAGVSRGAQLHHFPTKAELLAAAVEHLLARRLREFEAALARARPGAQSLDDIVDLAWSMFDGPVFVAWVELWIAARTDTDLAEIMIDVDRRFTEESRALAVEVLTDLGPNDPERFEMVRDFIIATMSGVAFQRLVPRGQRPATDYLDLLKEAARSMLDQPQWPEPRR